MAGHPSPSTDITLCHNPSFGILQRFIDVFFFQVEGSDLEAGEVAGPEGAALDGSANFATIPRLG